MYAIISTTNEREVLKMYEYEMMNKKTNEISFLFSSSKPLSELMKNANMNPAEWVCVNAEYID